MKPNYIAYIQLTSAQLLVGFNIVATKYLAPLFPIYVHLGLRFLISFLILAAVQLALREKIINDPVGPQKILKREWQLLFFVALTAGFLFNIFMVHGVKLTSATAAGIVSSTTPAFIALLSLIFLREVLGLTKWIAIGMAMTGVAIINLGVGHGGALGADHSMLGDFLVLLAVVPEAIYTILAKLLGNRIRPLACALIVNFFITLMFLPFAIYQLSSWSHGDFSAFNWLILGFAASASAGFYMFWQAGIKMVSASTAAIFTSFMPVGAVLAAICFLDEKFTINEALGMGCVLFSIVIGAGLLDKFKGKLKLIRA